MKIKKSLLIIVTYCGKPNAHKELESKKYILALSNKDLSNVAVYLFDIFKILSAMTERVWLFIELFSEAMVIRSQDSRPSFDNNVPSTEP